MKGPFCPRCGTPLMPGPRGGLARNYYCRDRAECRNGFNLTILQDQIVIISVIGFVEDDVFEMYLTKE